MNTVPTIQKLRASLLLALLVLCTLPRFYFHELLADHQDLLVCKHEAEKGTCMHVPGYHCDFHELVVQAPYEPAQPAEALPAPQPLAALATIFRTAHHSFAFRVTDPRGPPPATFI